MQSYLWWKFLSWRIHSRNWINDEGIYHGKIEYKLRRYHFSLKIFSIIILYSICIMRELPVLVLFEHNWMSAEIYICIYYIYDEAFMLMNLFTKQNIMYYYVLCIKILAATILILSMYVFLFGKYFINIDFRGIYQWEIYILGKIEYYVYMQ
jgi:hypothetical protein